MQFRTEFPAGHSDGVWGGRLYIFIRANLFKAGEVRVISLLLGGSCEPQILRIHYPQGRLKRAVKQTDYWEARILRLSREIRGSRPQPHSDVDHIPCNSHLFGRSQSRIHIHEEEDIWPIHPIVSSIDTLLFNYLGIYFGPVDP